MKYDKAAHAVPSLRKPPLTARNADKVGCADALLHGPVLWPFAKMPDGDDRAPLPFGDLDQLFHEATDLNVVAGVHARHECLYRVQEHQPGLMLCNLGFQPVDHFLRQLKAPRL